MGLGVILEQDMSQFGLRFDALQGIRNCSPFRELESLLCKLKGNLCQPAVATVCECEVRSHFLATTHPPKQVLII